MAVAPGSGATTLVQGAVNKFDNTNEIRVTFTADGTAANDNTVFVIPGVTKPSRATLGTGITFTAANSSHETQAAFRAVCELIGFVVESIRIEDSTGTNFDSILRINDGALNAQDGAPMEIPLSEFKESLGGAINTKVVIPQKFSVGPRTYMSIGLKKSTSVTVVFKVSQAGVIMAAPL